jgi:AmmeMemoRadiSam system radical SAM enzyme/AmmeMemoRadiSam system protein B/AmmeMemoRadiSam system protein A
MSQINAAHVGKWWHRDESSNRIICDLCPRHCSMKEGDRGFCFVRKIQGDQMVLDTYGRSTGFCIDPIEKKPLNHFYPGTSVLSFGTAGCNLGCQFCQNWDISKSREVSKLSATAEPELIATAAKQLGCKSVAYTYNDPVVWAEYAIETAKACRQLGVQSVAVTAGYMSPNARRDFYVHMDAANVDLKAFSSEFYRKITYSQIEPVLDTLRYLKNDTDVWFEITNLIIPDLNDSTDELRAMCDWILEHLGPDVPVHFSAFHPDFRMMDRARTPVETLLKAHAIAKRCGLNYPYVGNVHDRVHSSTYCRACHALLIERDWYELGKYEILGNLCAICGAEQAGRFETTPGTWGRKRQPVNLDSFRQTELTSVNNRLSLPILPDLIAPPQRATGFASADTGADNGEASATKQFVSTEDETMTSPLLSTPVKLAMLKLDELTADQKRSIQRAAQIAVVAAATGRRLDKDWCNFLGELADLHVMGLFTTLNRGLQLRGCCGFVGRPTHLKEALLTSAQRTATEDTRMPAISTVELPYLSLDVSLLASPVPLTVPPAQRPEHIVIGKHGLKITRGDQAGLLLPSVPVEQKWNVEQFLQGVCRKAGMPENAWLDGSTLLEIFEGDVIEGTIESDILPVVLPPKMPPGNIESLQRLKQVTTQNLIAFAQGGTPSYVALDAMDGTVNGVVLTLVDSATSRPLAHWIKSSLRTGMALQASLFEMCAAAAQVLKSAKFQKETDIELAITVLFDPAHHGAIQHEDWDGSQLKTELSRCSLEGIKTDQRAIVTACGDYAAVAFDAEKNVMQLLNEAASAIKSRRNPVGVYSLACISTAVGLLATNASPSLSEPVNRAPAIAEGFYPSNPESRQKLVGEFKATLPAELSTQPALAIMTPHAGLRYSGQVAMDIWSRVALPSTVVIIGPKHTQYGREWAVSPSPIWELPGGLQWEIDLPLSRAIVDGVEGMEFDFAAHAREHGVEIQLPILEALTTKETRPKIVAIAMKSASIEEIMRAAEQLASVLRAWPEMPLLAISSDLNHYSPEAENRRRDRIAINAMLTGEPMKLIEACQSNKVSMCGLVEAAVVMQTLKNLGHDFVVEEISYDNSAKRGTPDRVVGYAGILFRSK